MDVSLRSFQIGTSLSPAIDCWQATDPHRPWLSKVVGEGLEETERSIGELTTLAGGWFDTIIRSAWSGGRALISILSLGVVTPIVAFYLLYDWDKMIATIDNWVPPAHQETFRALAREIDNNQRIRAWAKLPLSRAHDILCWAATANWSRARHLNRRSNRMAATFRARLLRRGRPEETRSKSGLRTRRRRSRLSASSTRQRTDGSKRRDAMQGKRRWSNEEFPASTL